MREAQPWAGMPAPQMHQPAAAGGPHPPAAVVLPRRLARTSLLQALIVTSGVLGAAMVFLIAVVVQAYLGEATDGPTSPNHPVTTGLFLLAAAIVAGGFLIVYRIGVNDARARGLPPDNARPLLTWRTVISPRGLSKWLFLPRGVYRVEDPITDRLALCRSYLGVGIIAAVLVSVDLSALTSMVPFLVTGAVNSFVLGTVVVVLTCAVLVLLAGQDRPRALGSMIRPGLTLAGTWALALGFVLLLDRVVTPGMEGAIVQQDAPVGAVVVSLLWVGLAAWLVAFFCFALVFITRYMFASQDAHPMAPAWASVVLSWAFLGLGAWTVNVGAWPLMFQAVDLPLPGRLTTLLGIGGAVTVTAVAGWEILRLRALGFRVRPWPGRPGDQR